MSVISRLGIAASILDQETKRFLRGLFNVSTIAAAGSTQADATPITTGKTVVTAANGTKGVVLPVAEVDMEVKVINSVADQALEVYPNSGAVINALSADAAFTIVAGTESTFYCDAALHWYTRAVGTLTGVATSSSTAELNLLDGSIAGTSVASKALVLGANKDTDILALPVGGLAIGAGAGTPLTGTAAELNILTGATVTAAELNTAADQSVQTETLTADGAISVTKRITKLEDTGTGAYTLAAPNAALLGMVKLIEMTVDNGDVTLALTNVDGAAPGTTATFNDAGDHIALVAGVSKWLYLNGTATLS